MSNWSIRTQLYAMSLIPTLIMALLLGSYFSITRLINIDNNLRHQGSSMLRQLEPAAKFGLISANKQVLQGLTNATLENPDIIAIAIFNQSGELAAFSGPDNFMDKTLAAYNQHKADSKRYLKFTVPLTIQQITINDYGLTKLSKIGEAGTTVGWISIILDNNTAYLAKVQTLLVTLIIVILGTLLSVLISWLLSINIIKPLKKITRGLNYIRHGNHNYIFKDINGLEFKRMADSINRISKKLKLAEHDFQHNLDQQTADLRLNLDEMEIQNIELNMALKNIARENRRKSEFIASLSHEIRTPMSSIIGFTNLLLETELSEFQKEYLVTIQKSANSLLAILNDILDFSKIEAGKFKLDAIPMNMREIIEEVMQGLAPETYQKKLELVPLIDPQIPAKLQGDPLRIKQILTNLVSNAIKFTESGTVCVKACLKNQSDSKVQLQISVIDTGIGLSEKEQKNLFKAFSQADVTTARRFGGTGLGLVISKQLIQQMGGTIEVHSKTGIGTTMYFSIRLKSLAQAGVPETNSRHYIARKIIAYEPHILSRKALQLTLKDKIKTILTLDTYEKLESALKADAAAQESCDFIFIGLNHEEIPSKNLQAEFHKIRAITLAPIIVMLNINHENIQKELINYGATACILKPVSQKKILQTLQTYISQSKHKQVTENINAHKNVTIKPDKPNILVAEDNPANLKLITALLEKKNVNLYTAHNGREAIDLADKHSLDLILLDLQMPKTDGYEAAKAIRSTTGKNKNTPIIAISAYISEEDKIKLANTGFDSFLLKPIDSEKLHELIQAHVTNKSVHIIDFEKSMQITGGNKTLAKEILSMLIRDLPAYSQKIKNYYQARDWQELKRVIHELNGACRFCALSKLQLQVHEFEDVLHQQNHEKYPELYEAVINEINAVFDYVAREKPGD